jgi:divalent metal cation (Fe/Co/Zn/Cd) transporter
VEAIRAAILAVDGVKALHQLRTRRMGSHALVDVHILVDPRLSVSEGHHIGEKVYERLARDVDEVSDVTVHIDPEDDEVSAPSGHLPLRGEMLMRLRGLWQGVPGAEHIEDVTLHYLNGEVHVEVWVAFHALASLGEVERLSKAIALAIAADEHVAKVDVLFHC